MLIFERVKEIKESDFECPVFFFGYGSLMYPSGINGRGMGTIYTKDMLIKCRLEHFQRGSYAVYNGKYYYSINPNEGSVINGVVFKIDNFKSIDALIKDEGAHKSYRKTPQGVMYDIAEISDLICDIFLPEKVKVYTLIAPTHKKVVSGTMDPWYIRHVWDGVQIYGNTFVKEFLNTGGVQVPKEINV